MKNRQAFVLAQKNLSQLPENELIRICAQVPFEEINSINLGGNEFDAKTGDCLAHAIRALPLNIREINLNGNFLGSMGKAMLGSIMKAPHLFVTYLKLGGNKLGEADKDVLVDAMKSLGRSSIEDLNLEFNKLNLKNATSLAEIFAALPRNVRRLNLSSNVLFKVEDLEEAICELCFVSELDLSFNGLWQYQNLTKLMENLPDSLNWINLTGNCCYPPIAVACLHDMLHALPENVTHINLSNNNLGRHIAHDELVELFKHLPEHLKFIDLRFNQLFERKDIDQKRQLLEALRASNPEREVKLGEYNQKRFFASQELSLNPVVAPIAPEIPGP